LNIERIAVFDILRGQNPANMGWSVALFGYVQSRIFELKRAERAGHTSSVFLFWAERAPETQACWEMIVGYIRSRKTQTWRRERERGREIMTLYVSFDVGKMELVFDISKRQSPTSM
jgi:hypothetical protein